MSFEDASGSKFTQLMAHHIFRYIYSGKDFTVMNTESMPNEIWSNS